MSVGEWATALFLTLVMSVAPCGSAETSPSPKAPDASSPDVRAARERAAGLMREGHGAYEKKDYALFLQKNEAAREAFPRGLRALLNIARAHALLGRVGESALALDRLTALGVHLDAATEADFAPVREEPGFRPALDRAAALLAPLVSGSEAFRLKEKDLITEGIAHDPTTGDFFLSSVHKGKIVRVGRSGPARDFSIEGQDGLFSVLALRVDAPRRLLWATSVALPQSRRFRKEDEGRALLAAFDLGTAKLVKTVPAPTGAKHNLNDLVIDTQGRLFVSDAVSSHLFVLDPGASALRVLVHAGTFVSPQGLALSADEKTLWVADYALGLARVEVGTGRVLFVDTPETPSLQGLDGLVAHEGALLAIQNGVAPHRVIRLRLDPSGTRVDRVETLERGHPAYDEPTLGVVVGSELFYVANSQWGSFTKDNSILPDDKLREPVVLRLPLR